MYLKFLGFSTISKFPPTIWTDTVQSSSAHIAYRYEGPGKMDAFYQISSYVQMQPEEQDWWKNMCLGVSEMILNSIQNVVWNFNTSYEVEIAEIHRKIGMNTVILISI